MLKGMMVRSWGEIGKVQIVTLYVFYPFVNQRCHRLSPIMLGLSFTLLLSNIFMKASIVMINIFQN